MANFSLKQKIILGCIPALIFLGLVCFSVSLRLESEKNHKKSVVKVFTTMQNVDFYEPWKAGSQVTLEGCGCVISDNRILTTAHIINKGTFIEVQKFGETKRYVAKVEQVGFDLNLAILTVGDKEFFKDTEPVVFGDMPSRGDKVMIYGGDELSVKEDTVSGIDVVWSWSGGRYVPALLTNKPIDPKDNGCPVFEGIKFIGIPFTCYNSDKSGSIIPVNVIQTFFKDIKNGRPYIGFPDMGVFNQNLKSLSLRKYYKLSPDQTGIVITKVLYGGSSDGLLKEDDILESLDGYSIDNEGYITVLKSERVNWYYLFALYSPGDEVPIVVFRDGREIRLKVKLKIISYLTPYRDDNRNPSYFLYAGLVFVPLTSNYFQTGKWNTFKPEIKDISFHGLPSPEHKQIVIISHVLPDEINTGYDKITDVVVDKVNGYAITEMKDLITAFDNPVGKYDVIEVDDRHGFGSKIVFDAKKSKHANAEIMANFKISTDRSKDLK
jgi:S1-C subfamily serine protease